MRNNKRYLNKDPRPYFVHNPMKEHLFYFVGLFLLGFIVFGTYWLGTH